jgi:hypothetical protein
MLLHFRQIFNNVFASNLQHLCEIQMPQSLISHITDIYSFLIANNLRIISETSKTITIVSGSISPHKPLATAVNDVTFLFGELDHQIIVTELADTKKICLESFYVQGFLRCFKSWNVDDPFSNNLGLASISIGDSSSFAHLNFF